MQEARDSRRKETQKHTPLPPTNHVENTGKTRQGAPTHPEERSATKAGKTRQRGTHPPREEEKNATRRKKRQQMDVLAELDVVLAQRPAGRSHRQKHKQSNRKKEKLILLSSVSPPNSCHPKGNKSWGTMQPPPFPFRPQKEPKHPKADKGQKLEGLR